MINTVSHSDLIKKKMSLQEFLSNNRGINDGADLPGERQAASMQQSTLHPTLLLTSLSLLSLSGATHKRL